MGFSYNVNVLNQKGTPAIYTDTFANRPAAGFAGRLFVANDTSAIYEDTGTAWVLIANVSSGAGTLQQVTTNGNTTDKGISISALGLSTNTLTVTSLTPGSVAFVGAADLITEDNANLFFDNTNNRLGIGTNTPGNVLDLHSALTTAILALNNTAGNQSFIAFLNTNVAKWRIGNSSTNTFDVFNVSTATNAISIDSSNVVTLIAQINGLSANFSDKITVQNNASIFGTSANGLVPLIIQANAVARAIQLKNVAGGTAEILVTGTASTSNISFGTFSTNDAVVIANNGYLGIGTTNPPYILSVAGGTNFTCHTTTDFVSGTTGSGIFIHTGANTGNTYSEIKTLSNGATQWNNLVLLAGGANLLIGSTTDDTTNKLQVTGTIKATAEIRVDSASAEGFVSNSTNNASFHGLTLQSNGVAYAGFVTNANTGEIKIGGYQTTNDYFPVLYSDGVASMEFGVGASPTVKIQNLAGTGSRTVLADANGVLSAPVSDQSIKENIEPLHYGLDTIMQLNPVQFEFIDTYKNYGQGLQIGNIAQDVEKIIPEAVFVTSSTGLKGIDYNQFNGIYIKAIQDQQKIIESLIERIEQLENK